MGLLERIVDATHSAMSGVKRAVHKFTDYVEQQYEQHSKYFNFKIASKAGPINAIAAFVINLPAGLGSAVYSAAKQGVYAFFSSGVTSRLNETIATQPWNRYLAITAAVVVPLAIGTIPAYFMHALSGTPLPLLTAAWALPIDLVANFLIARHFRRAQEKILNNYWIDRSLKYITGNGNGAAYTYRPALSYNTPQVAPT